jgi:small GTP-binding protein
MMKLNDKLVWKIVFLGASTGKSSILKRFKGEAFEPTIAPTINFEYHMEQRNIDANQVIMQFWDIPSQEKYQVSASSIYRCTKALILVFDVTDAVSLTTIDDYLEDAKKYFSNAPPCVFIVANKIESSQREVPIEVGKNWAAQRSCPYFEASAKTGANVKELFDGLASVLLERGLPRELRARSEPNPLSVMADLFRDGLRKFGSFASSGGDAKREDGRRLSIASEEKKVEKSTDGESSDGGPNQLLNKVFSFFSKAKKSL